MGIPKMFRFLTDRYPVILQALDEDQVYDNFYLDMNGIIHQCTHPDDSTPVANNTESFFEAIFEYTEKLFRIVGPRKLMFLAIDGVAPRAKMNQQRSRRFRSAKEAERSMVEAISRGEDIPEGKPFDSNCITPGTQFMTDLSVRFCEWIDMKMATDPAWQQGCTVVFSGSEVPGEGEHKLVDYVRKWCASDDYDPSIRHCMYGLDADLMMLGLLARTPHFTLLREKQRFGRRGVRKTPQLKGTRNDAREFDLLPIALLRDMLFLEFSRPEPGRSKQTAAELKAALQEQRKNMFSSSSGGQGGGEHERKSNTENRSGGSGPKSAFKYSARRVVDDFVFMCMLVGNDFIPNVPHLDIAEGALNNMFRVYKSMISSWRGYLTDEHRLHPDRLESFLASLAENEPHYFANRSFDDGVPEYKSPEEYRRAYYSIKFGFDVDSSEGQERLVLLRKNYLEGLHWCLQYYHKGVSSWNWFYPEFYAPLACDMVDLRSLKISFKRGRPFSPVEQLLSVLPPHSSQFLPGPMQDLMVNPHSPILDFYPDNFAVDQNAKRNAWEAVVLIPFIDEDRLLREVSKIDRAKDLSEEERARDVQGVDHWFYARDYPSSRANIPPLRPSKFAPGRQLIRSPSSSSSDSSSNRDTWRQSRGRGENRGADSRRRGGITRGASRAGRGEPRDVGGASRGSGRGLSDDSTRGRGRGTSRGSFRGRGSPGTDGQPRNGLGDSENWGEGFTQR